MEDIECFETSKIETSGNYPKENILYYIILNNVYKYTSCLLYIHLHHSHRDQRVNAGWKTIVMYSVK